MFGLKALFAAMARLTAAISRSADLFESANMQLAQQLGYEPESPAIEHDGESVPARRKAK